MLGEPARFRLYAPLLLVFSLPVFGQAPFTEFVIFGDSLSDNGNLYAGTSALGDPTPEPPKYATGEFTDGVNSIPSTTSPLGLWIEQLAKKMNLPAPVPFIKGTGGLNYAVGGAVTGHNPNWTPTSLTQIPALTDQLTLFMNQHPSPPSSALYVFWGGSNDILNSPSRASTEATTAVANIQGNINTLIAAGAKYFLWLDLAPLGLIPEAYNTSNSPIFNAAAVAYNTAWSSAISQLKAAHPGITIVGVDVYSLFLSIAVNPALFGYTNITSPAQGQASVNPNTYVFWDQLHPTTVGHENVMELTYIDLESAFGGPAYACTNTAAPLITSVNSASAYGGYSYFASGSWLEIKGTNLADPNDPRIYTNGGGWAGTDFSGVNAPTSLDGISVSIDGKPAYIDYISPTQVNVQAPEDSTTGNVAIALTNCKAPSTQFLFAKQALAPGLLAPSVFNISGKQYMVATFASDGAFVLNTTTGAGLGINSRPAQAGDVILAYGVGFGDVTPATLPGTIVQAQNSLNNAVTFSFGSTPASTSYSGLAGNFVGLYEFYITVPSGLLAGDVEINVTQNGVALPQTMYLTIGN
jgi:uncharacterized protein (TIGR03437 family)